MVESSSRLWGGHFQRRLVSTLALFDLSTRREPTVAAVSKACVNCPFSSKYHQDTTKTIARDRAQQGIHPGHGDVSMNRSINSSAPLSPLLPLPLITAAGAACHGRHLHPCQHLMTDALSQFASQAPSSRPLAASSSSSPPDLLRHYLLVAATRQWPSALCRRQLFMIITCWPTLFVTNAALSHRKLPPPCCQQLFVAARSYPPPSPYRRHTPQWPSALCRRQLFMIITHVAASILCRAAALSLLITRSSCCHLTHCHRQRHRLILAPSRVTAVVSNLCA